jgi:hypothetical protein
MTAAEAFVPSAVQKARNIRSLMVQLESAASALKAEWNAVGGAAMTGYDTLDWSAYPFLKQDFTDGINDLTTAHNAIALSTITSVGGYSKVVKLATGG